jgi:hypothetical protein
MEYTMRQPIICSQRPAADVTQENRETWAQAALDLANQFPDSTYTINFSNGNAVGIPLLTRLNNNTDWQDEAFRTALSHRANVSVSGGSDKHRYYSAFTYLNQEGILIGNEYERFSGRFNLNSQWTSKLSSDLSFGYIKTNNNRLNSDADIGNPMQMILLPPSDAPDPDNDYILEVRSSEYNPQTEIFNARNFETSDRMNGSMAFTYEFNENLTLDVDGGIDYLDLVEERLQGPATQEGNPTGLARYGTTDVFNYIINAYGTYEKSFGNSNLSAMLGTSYQKSNSDFTFRLARVNSISELRSLNETDPSLLNLPLPGSAFSFLSYFSRVNYSIDEKYTFQLSGRVDGSSKFRDFIGVFLFLTFVTTKAFEVIAIAEILAITTKTIIFFYGV